MSYTCYVCCVYMCICVCMCVVYILCMWFVCSICRGETGCYVSMLGDLGRLYCGLCVCIACTLVCSYKGVWCTEHVSKAKQDM